MRTITKLFMIFGGVMIFLCLTTLAIIYDGIYIQLVFDTGLVVLTAGITYQLKAGDKKEAS